MTEEEYFRKHYQDYCYGDRLLSPYWDLFEDGTEFGERQSEKKIEELEKENAILKGRTEGFEKQILGLLYKYESVYKRFPDLKDAMSEAERVLKENAELKSELSKKADTNHSLVEQMAKLESKNAELKQNLEVLEGQTPLKDIKDKSEIIGKLTKAKEIIKGLLSCCRNYPQENAEKMEQAEQFLKEIDK